MAKKVILKTLRALKFTKVMKSLGIVTGLSRGLTVPYRFQVVYINGILCEKSKMCCSSRFNA